MDADEKEIISDDDEKETISDTDSETREHSDNEESQHDEALIYIDADVYENEMKQFECANAALLEAEGKLKKLCKITKPEETELLRKRVIKLQCSFETKAKYIDSLRIRNNIEQETKPSWDTLFSDLNRNRSKNKNTSLAEFYSQKKNIVNGLQELYKPLDSCPGGDEFSSIPEGLKVPLLKHQQFALTWLKWREQAVPKGGILADDMGLGKTLEIIAVVVDEKVSETRYIKKEPLKNESFDDCDKCEWAIKEKGDFESMVVDLPYFKLLANTSSDEDEETKPLATYASCSKNLSRKRKLSLDQEDKSIELKKVIKTESSVEDDASHAKQVQNTTKLQLEQENIEGINSVKKEISDEDDDDDTKPLATYSFRSKQIFNTRKRKLSSKVEVKPIEKKNIKLESSDDDDSIPLSAYLSHSNTNMPKNLDSSIKQEDKLSEEKTFVKTEIDSKSKIKTELETLATAIKEETTDSYSLMDMYSEEFLAKEFANNKNGGTLVVCPASVMRQWENEVYNKVDDNLLTVYVYHGKDRELDAKVLCKFDIVITSYSIVAIDYHKRYSPIFHIEWRRIVLDEAHIIRNSKTKCFSAVKELRGIYRWALTGTPIQNRAKDAFALLSFLGCPSFKDIKDWNKWFCEGSRGYHRLNFFLKPLLLRRTKKELIASGELQSMPLKTIKLIEVKLRADEMLVYQEVLTFSQTLFQEFLSQRCDEIGDSIYDRSRPSRQVVLRDSIDEIHKKLYDKFKKLFDVDKKVNMYVILVLILRLRQICCHPGLIDAMLEDTDIDMLDLSTNSNTRADINLLEKLQQQSDDLDVDADFEIVENSSVNNKKAVLSRSNPIFKFGFPSSKMLLILEIVDNILLNTNDKLIIVSQWTGYLCIIKEHLRFREVEALEFNGTTSPLDRQDVLAEFDNYESDKRVLLLSLTAGGVGLNLVAANHLLLIDLHWNPQLEVQAQDRIYRVGQKKDIFIYRFMCKDTIEQRIKALQEHKLGIADVVLNGSSVISNTRLTIGDIKKLFDM